MDITVKDLGRHKVLKVVGDVDLYNVGELKQSIFKLLDAEDVKSLIIDMQSIDYMDSSGIGALVAGHKKIKTKGGRFALLNVKEDVLNILKLATLDQFFKIYSDEYQIEAQLE